MLYKHLGGFPLPFLLTWLLTGFLCQEVLTPRNKGEAPEASHPAASGMKAKPSSTCHLKPWWLQASTETSLPPSPLSHHGTLGCIPRSGKDLERYLLPSSHLPSSGEENPPHLWAHCFSQWWYHLPLLGGPYLRNTVSLILNSYPQCSGRSQWLPWSPCGCV